MAGNWYRDDDRGGSNQWRGEGRARSNSSFGEEDRDRRWQSGEGRGGSDGDRGFFERAGDEVRSWFGDDNDSGRRRERELREDDRGWGGLMPNSGQPERYQQRGSSSGMGSQQDRSEPWGGGDWAGQGERNFGGPGANSRGGSGRAAPSHYGPEHGFGGFQGDYGGGTGQGGFGGQGDYQGGRQSFSGGQSRGGRYGSHPDDHYRSWRDRQIEQMDREYDEYRRERQQSFHSDFESWRQSRQAGSGLGASASVGSSATSSLTGTETGGGASAGTGDMRGSSDESGASAGGGEDMAASKPAGTTRTKG